MLCLISQLAEANRTTSHVHSMPSQFVKQLEWRLRFQR